MADGGGILLCLIQKKGEKLSRIPAQPQSRRLKKSLKNIIKEWVSR